MKKIIFTTLILWLVVSVFAQTDKGTELFREYWRESNPVNFLKAYEVLNLFEAIGDNEDIQELMPNQLAPYYLYLMHNREAIRILNTLIENIEQYPAGVQFGIGNALLARGEYTEAIKIYEKLNASSPDWSCPWRHKGEAYFRLRDFPNAEAALLKSIETRDTHYDAYLMLAEVYFEQKKNRPALQTIEKAFEVLGADAEDPEEVYTHEETRFLYWEILKANKDRRARTIEAELREKYPHRF